MDRGFNSGEDYIYLAKFKGQKDYMGKDCLTWFYAKYDNKEFYPLEKYAILEHIDMLKRHMESMDESRKVA